MARPELVLADVSVPVSFCVLRLQFLVFFREREFSARSLEISK